MNSKAIRPGDHLVKYITLLPKQVPAGMVLVHNQVRPTRRLGSRGFRAWLQEAGNPGIESCSCGWAKELGIHFRVKGIPERP